MKIFHLRRLAVLGIMLIFVSCSTRKQSCILDSSIIDTYIEKFNQNDEELYAQIFPNTEAAGFLKANIPLFECPDKDMESTYYFRWWTFRKHIKQTPDGFIITEFLPDVPWAGKYNGICCPAMLHYNEGRWLRNQTYLDDYTRYWLRGGGSLRTYSFPVAYALHQYSLVTGKDSLLRNFLPDLMNNFGEWEKERFDAPRGLFWQIDGCDGMEVSICGSGYRATINSYMAAEAQAIAGIAKKCKDDSGARGYKEKSDAILKNMFQTLWDQEAGFFKVLPREENAILCNARELHGYTPWAFDLAGPEYAGAWKYIMDTTYFYAPYGPTTAERRHPGFAVSYEGHECQWNGPSWPLSTSITLTGLANLLNNQQQGVISKEDYFDLLKVFTKCHHRTREDGTAVPWIDENINPFTGDWIARTRLKGWGWNPEKGGKERGKDYNHSSYCDLIISGLVGIRPQEGNELVVNPLLPEGVWDYFCLENVPYHGKNITVVYDKTGEKYKKDKGLVIFVDGKKAASAPGLSTLKCEI